MDEGGAVGFDEGFLCVFELLLQADEGFVFEAGGQFEAAAALGFFELGLRGGDLRFDVFDVRDGGLVGVPSRGQFGVAGFEFGKLFFRLDRKSVV